jgi:hypothetical protein
LVKDDVISKIKKLNYIGTLEILPVLLEINEEILFLVVVYRPNGPIGTFVNTLINTIDSLVTENQIQKHRKIIIGDFNWDQMLPEHVTTFTPLCSHLNLHQRSNFSTHIKGGILDLVFDDSRNTTVEWMFSPYSDHSKLLIEL